MYLQTNKQVPVALWLVLLISITAGPYTLGGVCEIGMLSQLVSINGLDYVMISIVLELLPTLAITWILSHFLWHQHSSRVVIYHLNIVTIGQKAILLSAISVLTLYWVLF